MHIERVLRSRARSLMPRSRHIGKWCSHGSGHDTESLAVEMASSSRSAASGIGEEEPVANFTFPRCSVKAEVTDFTGLFQENMQRRLSKKPTPFPDYEEPRTLSRRKRAKEKLSASAHHLKASLKKKMERAMTKILDRNKASAVTIPRTTKGTGEPAQAILVLKWGMIELVYCNATETAHYLALCNADISKIDATTMQLNAETVEGRRKGKMRLAEDRIFHIKFEEANEMEQFYNDVDTSSKWEFESFYDLEIRISKGAFGEVFECVRRGGAGSISNPKPQKLACKVMKNANQPSFDDVVRELNISSKMNHANVIQTKDILVTPFNTYLILPRLQTSMCKFQDDFPSGIMSEDVASYLILKVLRGLAYIHDHANVLHRDMKPSNVLVTESRRSTETKPEIELRICDFGHSADFSVGGPAWTSYTGLYGTPLFFSPEAVQKQFYSDKSDIWAVGVMMYQALTQAYPFDGKNEKDMFKNITKKKPHKNDRIKKASKECRELLTAMLSKDPNDRPVASMAQHAKWFEVTKAKALLRKELAGQGAAAGSSAAAGASAAIRSGVRRGVRFG